MLKEHFKLHEGGKEKSSNFLEFKRALEEWQCERGEKPRWCVYGIAPDLGRGEGVMWWIKPLQGDRFAAERIAKLFNAEGFGDLRAEMTEWNEDLEGKPIYDKGDGKVQMAEPLYDLGKIGEGEKKKMINFPYDMT